MYREAVKKKKRFSHLNYRKPILGISRLTTYLKNTKIFQRQKKKKSLFRYSVEYTLIYDIKERNAS